MVTLSPSADPSLNRVYRLSPVVKITLVNLYLALTVPLPILAQVNQQQRLLNIALSIGLVLGLVALWGALSEQVLLDSQKIQVRYSTWVPTFFRSGWQLAWSDITALKCRSTGQGGLVYYFVTAAGDQAYLLPMRVAGFNRLTQDVSAQTGLDTRDVRPLSQPWMYFLLFLFTLILWAVEAGTAVLVWQNPPTI